jgi:hypothetical protein
MTQNYAIIKEGVVVNVTTADTALDDNWVLLEGSFGIGDSYINGVFSKETPEPTTAEIIDSLEAQFFKETQEKLDLFANERGYDNIASLCSYANSSIDSFSEEAMRGVELRDSVWTACFEAVSKVRSGEMNYQEGLPQLEEMLPSLTWTS